MKVSKLTGAVIRYNTIVGGSGPGIWCDWENYGNRIEGNLFRNAYAYAAGVEASPGPNLIGNNLSINLRPGPAWFRAAILAWDSENTWAMNNTIDGRRTPREGLRDNTGTLGIDITGKPVDRGTRWGPVDARSKQVYVNNLIVGCERAADPARADIVAANYTDWGQGAQSLGYPPEFNSAGGDYRLAPDSPYNQLGVENEYTPFVTHDFYGLLRFSDWWRSVGAFRADPLPASNAATLVELELQSGALLRLYESPPKSAIRNAAIPRVARKPTRLLGKQSRRLAHK
jgi:hypothetical protein